ncbi:MAG TPA: peptidase U32 family protein [Candidatus Ozemobacteraceae bacterium]|nr:peptidase U32 family protein [Candidatus Ozemobacteraceae bacterium]
MTNARRVELLAPAGDQSCLKAALLAGADAVYLAGKRFGARAFAPNFDDAGLRWARNVTASLNRKLYITLNTIVFDHEMHLLEQALDFYEVLQPDALIIQDLGVAALLAARGSTIPRHLSTQAAWYATGGVEVLQKLGITRVILPREMSLDEIREAAARVPFEVETFVHGAMCYSISGRCFWSAALGTRSGNRGTCAQPCRKAYSAGDGKPGDWLFSPRDLRLIGAVPELVGAGISSLKIEGRMKGPEYVHAVVSAYRRAIDGERPGTAQDEELSAVFSRPFHTGFLHGTPPRDWNTPEQPGREAQTVGRVAGPGRGGLLEIDVSVQVKPGDGLAWDTPDGGRNGARITWMEPAGRTGRWLIRGLPASLPAGTVLRRTDVSAEMPWLKHWNRDWERYPVDLFWSGREGQPLAVETIVNGRPVRLQSDALLAHALGGRGLEMGPLPQKFHLLGESFAARRHVTRALEEGMFIPPGDLKRLKRNLVDTLIRLATLPPPSQPTPAAPAVAVTAPADSSRPAPAPKPGITLRLFNRAFPIHRDIGPDRWLLPFEDRAALPDTVDPARVGFWLPPVTSWRRLGELARALDELPDQEFLCMGWEAFELTRRLPRHTFRLDWCFNLANTSGCQIVRQQGLVPTATREWPAQQPPTDSDVFWSLAHNPLVSLSRFPVLAERNRIITNPHRDRFFLMELAPGTTGLFLVSPLAALAAPRNLPLQIDVAVAPHESPFRVLGQIEQLIAAGRSRNRSS